MSPTPKTPTSHKLQAPYAVVATGGKQYVVRQGSVLTVEKLAGEQGGQVTLSSVLALHNGTTLSLGRPHVAGAQVVCQVVAQQRAPKVVSYKYKRRKGFHWKKGHRQSVTRLKVLEVSHGV
ncbi:MAG: 50S ribosomal protein L21 [Omnitrophica WOR_2 bacterium RIFCSPHIGHO2_02_FULL_68_15]|nr:MAG: 50S ribosomal protein L21 [Omnitrophica WOR_2 bacterium RIFCSPHIGHO2_02_FULL_68_15]